MSDSIIVRVRLGVFNLVRPTDQQTQVYAQIPNVGRVSYLLDPTAYPLLKDEQWATVLDVAHGEFVRSGAVSDSATASARKAVRSWLQHDENRDAMQAAWEADQARQHPVARKLLKENEQLREHVIARDAEIERLKALIEAARDVHVKHKDSEHCQHDGEQELVRRSVDAQFPHVAAFLRETGGAS